MVAAVNVVVVVVIVFVVLKAYLMNKNAWRRECRKIVSLDLVHIKKIFACQIQKIKNPRM